MLDVPGPRWDDVAALVRVLAARLADGALFTPGQALTVGADALTFSRFTPAPGAELHLNNDALLINPA